MVVLLIVFCNGLLLNAQNSKISSQLDNALIHVPVDETIKIWIYFTNKGNNINLEKIKNNLTEKAKKRRAKVLGEKLVDNFDVAVNPQYIKNVKPFINKIIVKSKWLNAISAEVTPNNTKELAKLSFVKRLDNVKRFKRNQPQNKDNFSPQEMIENTYMAEEIRLQIMVD